MQLRRSEHRKVLCGMRCEKAGGGLDLSVLRGIKQRKILHGMRRKAAGRNTDLPVRQMRLEAEGSGASAKILPGVR